MFAKADAKLLGNQARAAVTMYIRPLAIMVFQKDRADYSPGDVHRFEKSGSFIGDVCVKHERGHEHYEQEYQRYEYYAYYRNSQKDNRRYQYHEHGYAHEQYAQTVEYQFSGAVFEKRYYLPERWLSAVFFLKYHVLWG